MQCSYLQYSSVAASVVRSCLKPEFKQVAAKRTESSLKVRVFENGKPSAPSMFWILCEYTFVCRMRSMVVALFRGVRVLMA